MSEFIAFRTLYHATPFSEAAAELICDCLNFYLKQSKVSIDGLEKIMALHKLREYQKETKK